MQITQIMNLRLAGMYPLGFEMLEYISFSVCIWLDQMVFNMTRGEHDPHHLSARK